MSTHDARRTRRPPAICPYCGKPVTPSGAQSIIHFKDGAGQWMIAHLECARVEAAKEK